VIKSKRLFHSLELQMEENMPKEEQKEWVDWLPGVKVLQKAVVVDDQGNILALRRRKTGPGARPGKWDLPGGSMSPEDLEGGKSNRHEQALIREVEEETGLKVEQIEVVHLASGIKHTKAAGDVLVLAIGYRCQVDGIRPGVIRSDEHIEDRWVSKGELLKLDFGEDDGFHPAVINRV